MADEIHHPHDLMVRAVLSDSAEATSFLQAHLPQDGEPGAELVDAEAAGGLLC